MSAPTAGQSQDSATVDNRRAAPRTNLMLAATAHTGIDVVPVRIRNVSETGALIEGEGLPSAGHLIHLSRGDAAVGAVVAWAAGIRRGVHFDQPVPIDVWRAGKPVFPTSGQKRADEIQKAAREGHGPDALPQPPPAERWIAQLDARMGEEMAFVQRLIEALGDQLIMDPAILHRHGQVLQNIDIASQILGHLSRVMAADERADAVRAIGMEELRARLTRQRSLG